MKAIKKHKGALIALGIFIFLGLMFACNITAIGGIGNCVGDPDECPPGLTDHYGFGATCCCCSELNWCFAVICCCKYEPCPDTGYCYTDISGYCYCIPQGCPPC